MFSAEATSTVSAQGRTARRVRWIPQNEARKDGTPHQRRLKDSMNYQDDPVAPTRLKERVSAFQLEGG